MLFTIPGFPSLYYGSEIGIHGARDDFSDKALRPFFDPSHGQDTWDHALLTFIQHLSQFRKTSPALQFGNYRQILLASEQFVYLRETAEERILVVFNASDQAQTLTLPTLHFSGQAVDLLDASYQTSIHNQAQVWLPQNSVRILQLRNRLTTEYDKISETIMEITKMKKLALVLFVLTLLLSACSQQPMVTIDIPADLEYDKTELIESIEKHSNARYTLIDNPDGSYSLQMKQRQYDKFIKDVAEVNVNSFAEIVEKYDYIKDITYNDDFTRNQNGRGSCQIS